MPSLKQQPTKTGASVYLKFLIFVTRTSAKQRVTERPGD